MTCIFCNIIARDIPSTIVYEDEDVIAFHDLQPQAPHHILIIPRKHIPTLNDITPDDSTLVAKLTLVAQELAKKLNIAETGYRLVMNCNIDGGQAVFHIHMHLLGGRPMAWPPG